MCREGIEMIKYADSIIIACIWFHLLRIIIDRQQVGAPFIVCNPVVMVKQTGKFLLTQSQGDLVA